MSSLFDWVIPTSLFVLLVGLVAYMWHDEHTRPHRIHQSAEDWVRQASVATIQDPTLHIWCTRDGMCQVFYRPPMEHDVSRISLRCTTRVCVEVK